MLGYLSFVTIQNWHHVVLKQDQLSPVSTRRMVCCGFELIMVLKTITATHICGWCTSGKREKCSLLFYSVKNWHCESFLILLGMQSALGCNNVKKNNSKVKKDERHGLPFFFLFVHSMASIMKGDLQCIHVTWIMNHVIQEDCVRSLLQNTGRQKRPKHNDTNENPEKKLLKCC